MAHLHQVLDASVDIAHKDHRGIGIDTLLTTTERAIGHVAFHNLNAVLVVHVNACHFVESHHIPCTYQSYLVLTHIIEQVCHRGLAAGNQDRIR